MKNSPRILEEKRAALESFAIDSVKWEVLQSLLQLQLVYCLSKFDKSTLSQAETEYVAKTGIAIGGKPLADQSIVYKYYQATSRLRASDIIATVQLSEEFLIDLNSLHFLDEAPAQDYAKYSYKVPYVLTEYIEWLSQKTGSAVVVVTEAAIKLLQANVFGEAYPRTILLFINFLLLKQKHPLIYIREALIPSFLAECTAVKTGGSTVGFSDLVAGSVADSLEWCLQQISNSGPTNKDELLKIGELAKLTNETVPTIRHWTKQGLLKVADHSEGGYQLYEKSMTEVVLKIRYLQREERLKVAEIKELVQ